MSLQVLEKCLANGHCPDVSSDQYFPGYEETTSAWMWGTSRELHFISAVIWCILYYNSFSYRIMYLTVWSNNVDWLYNRVGQGSATCGSPDVWKYNAGSCSFTTAIEPHVAAVVALCPYSLSFLLCSIHIYRVVSIINWLHETVPQPLHNGHLVESATEALNGASNAGVLIAWEDLFML